MRAFEGVYDLLEHLDALGFRLAIATSGNPTDLRSMLAMTGLARFFESAATGEDAEVKASKPAPDVIQSALKKLRIGPSDAVMVGDTPYDVTAAKKAGVSAIAFSQSGWRGHALDGAIAVYSGPLEMHRKLDFSPLVTELSNEYGAENLPSPGFRLRS